MRKILPATVVLWLFLVAGTTNSADEQGDVKAIIERAQQTHGGAAKLSNFKAATWKGKGTFHGAGDARPFTAEYAVQFPDKSRFDISGEMGFRFIMVCDGKKGWVHVGDENREMDEATVAERKEDIFSSWLATLAPLIDKGVTLSALGESKVSDRTAVGVKAAAKGHRDLRLYFDEETGLLAKAASMTKDPGSNVELEEEHLYSDYGDVEGVKRAMKIKVMRSGQVYVDVTYSDYKLAEKLDDKVFVEP